MLKTVRKIIIPAFLFSFAVLTGCNSLSNDPKVVLIHFFDAMQTKDFTEAGKLTTTDSKQFLDAIKSSQHSSALVDYFSDYDKTKMEIEEPVIKNGIAKIRVMQSIKEGSISPVYTLKKEDGHWKVALDFISQIDLGSPVNHKASEN